MPADVDFPPSTAAILRRLSEFSLDFGAMSPDFGNPPRDISGISGDIRAPSPKFSFLPRPRRFSRRLWEFSTDIDVMSPDCGNSLGRLRQSPQTFQLYRLTFSVLPRTWARCLQTSSNPPRRILATGGHFRLLRRDSRSSLDIGASPRRWAECPATKRLRRLLWRDVSGDCEKSSEGDDHSG